MTNKIYLHLLILCGIWAQGIIETFANEEIKKSSGLLVRNKRVINYVANEDATTQIMNVPYVVTIRRNGHIICVGSILSFHVVITISVCASPDAPSQYTVLSSSARSNRGNNKIHNVINIIHQYGTYTIRRDVGIALLTVNPPFVYGLHSFNIELHVAPLMAGTFALVAGWGYNNIVGANPGTNCTTTLRYIVVPIMPHRECVNIYRPHNIHISEEEICTYHPQRHCGHTDGGAPLVIDGQLAGVRLWTGPEKGQVNTQYPDVFAMIQHSIYNQWIRRNIRNIEGQFHNHRK